MNPFQTIFKALQIKAGEVGGSLDHTSTAYDPNNPDRPKTICEGMVDARNSGKVTPQDRALIGKERNASPIGVIAQALGQGAAELLGGLGSLGANPAPLDLRPDEPEERSAGIGMRAIGMREYFKRFMLEYARKQQGALQGVFDPSGTGTIVASHAGPSLQDELWTRGHHNYHFAKIVAKATEGLTSLKLKTINFVFGNKNILAQFGEQRDAKGPFYRAYLGFQARPGVEPNIPENPAPVELHTPKEQVLEEMKRLMRPAEDGVVKNGQGLAVINIIVPAPVPGETALPEYEQLLEQAKAEWLARYRAQGINREIKNEKFLNVDDSFTSHNALKGKIDASFFGGEVTQSVLSVLVVFDTDEADSEKRILSDEVIGAGRGYDASDPTLTKFYRLSRESAESEPMHQMRQGNFAANGNGLAIFLRKCPPDQVGEMSIWGMQYEWLWDAAQGLFGNPHFEGHKVSESINAISYRWIKDNHFKPISTAHIPYGEPVGSEGERKSYMFEVQFHMRDPMAKVDPNYQGFPPPDPVHFGRYLPDWDLAPNDTLHHVTNYDRWYDAQNQTQDRSRVHFDTIEKWFYGRDQSKGPAEDTVSTPEERAALLAAERKQMSGWRAGHYNGTVDGIMHKSGYGEFYFEWDAVDIRGQQKSFEEIYLEWAQIWRRWHDDPRNCFKEIVSIDQVGGPEDENMDPAHWNKRFLAFGIFFDPAWAKAHKEDKAELRSAEGWERVQDLAWTHNLTVTGRQAEDRRPAEFGFENRDGRLICISDYPAPPQMTGEPTEVREQSRRRSAQQAIIRRLEILGRNIRRGFIPVTHKIQHVWDNHQPVRSNGFLTPGQLALLHYVRRGSPAAEGVADRLRDMGLLGSLVASEVLEEQGISDN